MSFNGINRIRPRGKESIKYEFVKKFAFIPKRCKGERFVWMEPYYNKYLSFSYDDVLNVTYLQYSLTEADAIIEKLIESR